MSENVDFASRLPTLMDVLFDITVAGHEVGRIVIGQFEDVVPLTVNNFVALATGEFFITAARAPRLDGKHVVFGKILEGMSVVHTIELQDTNDRNLPYTECVIVNSGKIEVKKQFIVEVEG
ncbi:unnamed protein product, partial [Coregonus sp. 'balchen']